MPVDGTATAVSDTRFNKIEDVTRHIWTRSKQPWVVFGADDETFETAPPA